MRKTGEELLTMRKVIRMLDTNTGLLHVFLERPTKEGTKRCWRQSLGSPGSGDCERGAPEGRYSDRYKGARA